ncbi:hypothetical protein GF324_00335, partial [bacterium]|nr:hypothetical protein [bacterium]
MKPSLPTLKERVQSFLDRVFGEQTDALSPEPDHPNRGMDHKQTGSGKRWKTTLVWVAKLLFAAAFIFILIRYIQFDRIRDTLSNANGLFLLSGLLLMPLNILCQSLRWRLLIASEVQEVSFFKVTASVLAGFAFGLMTPGRTGEIIRVMLLKVPSKIRLAGLHLLDKLF